MQINIKIGDRVKSNTGLKGKVHHGGYSDWLQVYDTKNIYRFVDIDGIEVYNKKVIWKKN